MDLTGSRTIAAARDTVWDRLSDAETLKSCIPGCTEMLGSLHAGFRAKVIYRVGPLAVTIRGSVMLTDIVPGESCTLRAEGSGGLAGFAQGNAKVRLLDVPGGTLLSYAGIATVGGRLERWGGGVIGAVAQKMADQFFAAFKQKVEISALANGTDPANTAEPRGQRSGA